jgi:hypothetical protein
VFAGVRDRWLCLGSFVFKNTNSKHQITNKSQISIFNYQNLPGQGIVWIFEFRSGILFDIWDLIFEISINQ